MGLMLCLLTACQTDETPSAKIMRTVEMTVNVSRQGDGSLSDGQSASRASLTENNGGHLAATWESGDKLIVKAEDGTHMGILSYTSAASDDTSSPENATFTGEVTTDAQGAIKCHFFYVHSTYDSTSPLPEFPPSGN